MKRRLCAFLACVPGCFLFGSQGMAADVDVHAEGAYSTDEVAVYVYADINGPAILSYGVKLTYDPAVLTVTSAEKNEAVWYLGDGTTNEPYMDPEINDTDGEVVIIGGKLDIAAPTAGVTGSRVLLGKVFFSRTCDVSAPPAFGLDYARMTADDPPVLGAYNNFVATDGTVLDDDDSIPDTGVDFIGSSVYERGDANADGSVSGTDIGSLKYHILNGGDDNPWKDVNADGNISGTDIGSLKFRILNAPVCP